MSIPTSEPLHSRDDKSLPPARRRRRKRMLLPNSTHERAEFIEKLARTLTPSFDFFLFSFLCGVLVGVAILTDSPAIFLLAALSAPFLKPLTGISLAAIFGSFQYLFQSISAFIIGSGIVFFCGMGTGWITRFFIIEKHTNALFHTTFSWPDFFVLTIGTIITVIVIVRNPNQKSIISSAALAYELYLPIGLAGFGLMAKINGLWPDGLLVYIVYLSWASFIGTLTLMIMGLRPNSIFGYTIGTTLLVVSIVALVAILGFETAVSQQLALPTSTPTITSTVTPTHTLTPHPTFTNTLPPTQTSTNTLVPTKTPTITVSPQPTPFWAMISAKGSDGANIREAPERTSKVISSLLNGVLVEIIPQPQTSETSSWVKVRTSAGNEGWVLLSLLSTDFNND
ncbi:MAG: SH3 domain-containing protein [Anaerolineaceae bacterium]|nr:SH3 domain-containing protein [Anaerolineaceae bacterium]